VTSNDHETDQRVRDRTAKHLSTLHQLLYRSTRGLVGRRLVDNDICLLATTGRLSGRIHTVPLLYLREGDRLVVIASWGGRAQHPDWYANLLTNPSATVQVLGDRWTVEAVTADSSERDVWWPRIVNAYDGYASYASRTDREIPVVFLEPRDSGAT
jgi:deazaflavin-dependent oxidoreductase (nitroreductase family)